MLFAFGYLHLGIGAHVDCASKPDGVWFPMTDYLMQSGNAKTHLKRARRKAVANETKTCGF